MKLQKLFELAGVDTTKGKAKKLLESIIGTTRSGISVQAGASSPTSMSFLINGKTITIDTSDIDWDGEEGFIWEEIMNDVKQQTQNTEVAELIANYVISAR